MKQPVGVHIDGVIYSNNGANIGSNELFVAIIEFIEQRGWHFGGGIHQVDEEGNRIEDID